MSLGAIMLALELSSTPLNESAAPSRESPGEADFDVNRDPGNPTHCPLALTKRQSIWLEAAQQAPPPLKSSVRVVAMCPAKDLEHPTSVPQTPCAKP